MLWGKIVTLLRSDQHLACNANNKLKMNDNAACAVWRRLFWIHSKLPESFDTWSKTNIRYAKPQTLISTALSRLCNITFPGKKRATHRCCSLIQDQQVRRRNWNSRTQQSHYNSQFNISRNAFWEIRVPWTWGGDLTFFKNWQSNSLPTGKSFSQMQPNFPTPGCTLLSVPRQNPRKAQ